MTMAFTDTLIPVISSLHDEINQQQNYIYQQKPPLLADLLLKKMTPRRVILALSFAKQSTHKNVNRHSIILRVLFLH